MTPVVSLPSVREVVGIAFYYKRRIAMAFMLPVAASLAVAFWLTPQYLAESKVLVRSGREYVTQPEVPGGIQTPPLMTMQETIDNEIEILTGHDLLQSIVNEVGVSRLYPLLAASPPPDKPLEDAAVELLGHDLVAVPAKLSDVLDISLRNPDRTVAVDTLQRVLGRFEEQHMAAFKRDRASFVEAELASDLQTLADVERERTAYQNEQGLFSVTEQRTALVQQRARDADALEAAEIDRATFSSQLDYLRGELAREPVSITLSSVEQESPAAAEAQARVEALREQQQQLLPRYHPDSLLLAPTRAALASAEQFAAREKARSTSVTTGPNALVATLKAQIVASGTSLAPLDAKVVLLGKAVNDDDAKLSKLTSGETRLLDLNRQADQLTATTATLRQRLVDARFLEDLDRARIASLDVIEQPSASFKAVFPKKIIFLAAGIAVGAVLSVLTLLLALTWGNRFLMVETVERVLGAPVSVAFPMVPARTMRRLPAPSVSIEDTAREVSAIR